MIHLKARLSLQSSMASSYQREAQYFIAKLIVPKSQATAARSPLCREADLLTKAMFFLFCLASIFKHKQSERKTVQV